MAWLSHKSTILPAFVQNSGTWAAMIVPIAYGRDEGHGGAGAMKVALLQTGQGHRRWSARRPAPA